VLDAGCGTGRVTAHLAAAGHEVHAIDISRPMLEVAHDHLRPWSTHTSVYYFDLRHQPLGEGVPVALVTLHAFNYLIDIEEQRLFLRHLRQSMTSPGILAVDLFCPLSLVRPEGAGEWRQIHRSYDDRRLIVRDRREMLTPLLERRTQIFRVNDGPEVEMVSHRRYVPPRQAAELLVEAGFESVHWLEGYDVTTARAMDEGDCPVGPFMILAEV
jgi:SAM-dependent methyltransferase